MFFQNLKASPKIGIDIRNDDDDNDMGVRDDVKMHNYLQLSM